MFSLLAWDRSCTVYYGAVHDVNKKTAIYRDTAADGGETRRAIRLCCGSIRPGGALLYLPGEAGWVEYWDQFFAPILAPHLVAVHAAATAGHLDRVIAADEALGGKLDGAQRARLADASVAVFEARAGAREVRVLERLGRNPGGCLFPTAFAVNAAAFNVPVLLAGVGALYMDWRAGSESGGLVLESAREWEDRFSAQLDVSPEPVGKVISRCMRRWQQVA